MSQLLGVDYKAIGNYEKVVLTRHPQGYMGGAFINLDGFKKSVGPIDHLLDTGKCPAFRHDLSWSDKNHTYDKSFRAIVKKNAQAIKPVILSHPSVRHFANPVTEHKLKEREWLVFADIVLQVLGDRIELVNVPMIGYGFVSKKYLNEYHGAEKFPRKGGRCCFSADGISIHDIFRNQLFKNYIDAEYILAWGPQENGNRKVSTDPKDFVPRKDREHWLTAKQLDVQAYTLNHVDGTAGFPKHCIGKCVSDQAKNHPKPQGKDCKPVFLAKLKAKIRPKRIALAVASGQVIANSTERMTWDDEANHKQLGYRWYFAEWGADISEKARRIQGHGGCRILADGKFIGVWDPAFRAGEQR